MAVDYKCCETQFFLHIAIITALVLFAGLMSGLTLGLMSLSLVDLEVVARSGVSHDRKQAEKILPVVKNQHLLLCTLLICNAAANEALPLFLDSIVSSLGSILISVTLILLFGEIIPQSLCSRHGLAIGAYLAPLVRVLVWICFPITYPLSKLLDVLVGKDHIALFRRAELKTLVDLHGNEAGKGGELTRDETTIIAGALELSEKKAKDAMTPISDTFAIDITAKLDWDLMKLLLGKGHSRVPVYNERPTNIIGIILVKNLLAVHPADEVPVKNVTIRQIPRVLETTPLYDLLNDFQKGHSHMAVVVRSGNESKEIQEIEEIQEIKSSADEVRVDIDDESPFGNIKKKVRKWKSFPNPDGNLDIAIPRSKSKRLDTHALSFDKCPFPMTAEAIGIITMEDVIEELLQEEIFDEKDQYHEDS